MKFQTTCTLSKEGTLAQALRRITPAEWITIGFFPFCFWVLSIDTFLGSLDSNVAIGCFLLVVGIVFLSWGLYRFVRPAYEVVKKLDGMGEPGTRLVFQIDENGLRIEKKWDGKDVTESFPLRDFQRYIDHPYFLELLDKEKPIVFYTGSLSKKEKMDLIAFLEQAGIRRR